MKTLPIFLSLLLLISIFSAQAQQNNNEVKNDSVTEHNAWLKETFSNQHEKLIPIVAVADMLYACNQQRKIEPVNYKLKDLIINMDKNRLAEKLILCLDDDSMQSEAALNFGLLGCFHEQLSHLPDIERQQKMALVKKTIVSLSRSERKKSFTQCVSAQATHYLQ
jgi:hypothetical protein